MNGQTSRLFVASPLPDELCPALEVTYRQREEIQAALGRKTSWVSPENWHLTWHFIGNVGKPDIPLLEDRLEAVLNDIDSAPVYLNTLSLWPNAKRPRLLVWEGSRKSLLPSDASLSGAAAEIARTIQGCFPDRPPDHSVFTPHITLARLKKPSDTAHKSESGSCQFNPMWIPPPHVWHIRSIHLYRSTLTPQGALYDSLRSWALKGPSC